MPQMPPPKAQPHGAQQHQNKPAPQAQPKTQAAPTAAAQQKPQPQAGDKPKPHDDHGRDHKHDDHKHDDKPEDKDSKGKDKGEEQKKAESDRPESTRQHDDAVNNPLTSEMPPAGIAPPEPNLPIGARPHDQRDPQSAKFEAEASPPFWKAPKDNAEQTAPEEWTPEPALDPREQKAPVGQYADGMSAPDEQRARAAWVEQHGMKEYEDETDERPEEDRPVFDPNIITGGALVRGQNQRGKQVPGVVPPTKRD